MHGGDIYRNKVNIDFSVNVNPFGMPKSVTEALNKAVNDCICYPDISCDELKKAISIMLSVKQESILCGNGSSELFPAITRAVSYSRNIRKQLKVLIPVPSFLGYERAAGSCNAEITFYEMEKEDDFCLTDDFLKCLKSDIDIIFLANPNNPTGKLIKPFLLENILDKCQRNNIIVVLDECFIEFVKEHEKLSFAKKSDKFHNLVIVRSFTKICAMPGVRLGYLVCNNAELMKKIELQLPEWNISVFAQKAGREAAKELEYIKNNARLIEEEKNYLTQSLIRMGIAVYPGCANFLLLYTQYPLAAKLLEKDILIRDCGNFRGLNQGYYRICVRKREDNEKLINAIREIVCR